MNSLLIKNKSEQFGPEAVQFCKEFCNANRLPKYVFGRNVYAKNVASLIEISGFIDDYTDEDSYLGKPIIKTNEIPKDALVLAASGGRPLSAKERLDTLGVRSLDYFAFYRLSGLPLIPAVFNEGFAEEFTSNINEYEWIYSLFEDDASRAIFKNLVNFRFTYDIKFLSEFKSKEHEQYFEDFLNLQSSGETFVDVGGFNGFNSQEFIKLCPEYREIHIFEPEPTNYQNCLNALTPYKNVHLYCSGLSNKKEVLKLDPQGSGSKISNEGSITIEVDKLDDVLPNDTTPTFIKMDIEGAELFALEGAQNTIRTHRPRLAVCVYHNVGDFWRIPKYILSLNKNYKIYLRHYTESIYETVMFFIPRNKV